MVQIALELLFIHFSICFFLIICDLIYGYRDLNWSFVKTTIIGGLVWPILLAILVGINIYNYFKRK